MTESNKEDATMTVEEPVVAVEKDLETASAGLTDSARDTEEPPAVDEQPKKPCYKTFMRFDGRRICQGYNIVSVG